MSGWSYRALQRGEPGRDADRKPYAVLDVETDGLRGDLVYWTATCECSDTVTDGRTAEALWRHVLAHDSRTHANRDHVWWAHNGGEYDYVYLLDPAKADALSGRARVDPVVRGDAMIGYRIRASKHRTDLRDSFALLPAGLASLAAQLSPTLPKLDIGLSSGVTFDPDRADHREYAARDVVATLAVLTRFRSILAERFDGALPSWSAASTALRAWTLTLGDDERYRRIAPSDEPLARAGYVGGLVHVGSIAWHDDAVALDVNSMYPSVMAEAGVPDGWSAPVGRFDRRRPGIYRCTVDVPADMAFTFVPYRDPRGNLAWPTGRFPAVLTSPEIVAAREHGVRVAVHGGVVWQRLAYPFGAYVGRVAAMRAEGGALGLVGKLLGNGLYGKFGARPTRDEWAISSRRPGDGWTPPAYDAFDDAAVKRYAGLWVRHDVPLRAPYLLPHWAAWITAGARLRLVALADAIGPDRVLYTDTDSVTAPRADIERAIAAGRVSVGSAFGQVKIEHRYARFRALAPKVYMGIEDGEPVYRAKGIPRKLVAAAFDTGLVEWDSPNAAIQVMQGAAMTTTRTRRLSDIGNSLAWRVDDDGRVRPVHLSYGGA